MKKLINKISQKYKNLLKSEIEILKSALYMIATYLIAFPADEILRASSVEGSLRTLFSFTLVLLPLIVSTIRFKIVLKILEIEDDPYHGYPKMHPVCIWNNERLFKKLSKYKTKEFNWYLGEDKHTNKSIFASGEDQPNILLLGGGDGSNSDYADKIIESTRAIYGKDVFIEIMEYGANPKYQDKQYLESFFKFFKDMLIKRCEMYRDLENETGVRCVSASNYRERAGKELKEIIIVIKDFDELSRVLNLKDGDYEKDSIAANLTLLARVGRTLGIRFIFSTKECSREAIPPHVLITTTVGILFHLNEKDLRYTDRVMGIHIPWWARSSVEEGKGAMAYGVREIEKKRNVFEALKKFCRVSSN